METHPLAVADLREGMRDARLPGSKFFQFHALFWGKFGKILCWHPPEGWLSHLGEILDPPLSRIDFNDSLLGYYLWHVFVVTAHNEVGAR